MSDLVQTVKEMYTAFGRGDVAGIMRHVADDVSWEAEGPTEMVFTGIRHGKQETLGFFEGIAQEHRDPKLGSGPSLPDCTPPAAGSIHWRTPCARYRPLSDRAPRC